jgi:cell division cycle protein 37
MEKAHQRIKMLERDLQKIAKMKADDSDDEDEDDGDDDLDDAEAIKIELEELRQQNETRVQKLDEYEKNKKWNVDNMFEVKEERTIINKEVAKNNFTDTGFAQSTVSGEEAKKHWETANAAAKTTEKEKKDEASSKQQAATTTTTTTTTTVSQEEPAAKKQPAKPTAGPAKPDAPRKNMPSPAEIEKDDKFIYTYHEFTEKYADLMETFMAIPSFNDSKEFLLKNGEIILQEHACNYLLLASLEDEMNGHRDKMRQTAKQSQIVTNIAELAKSWGTHPGNVIVPFFQRLEQRQFLEGFMEGMEVFIQKIVGRAVTKKTEIDRQRKTGTDAEGTDLSEIPLEERLGPGGLDPLEVIETLPIELQEAFESRDVEQLKAVLRKLDPKDAEYHMKRCVDSGLWQAEA